MSITAKLVSYLEKIVAFHTADENECFLAEHANVSHRRTARGNSPKPTDSAPKMETSKRDRYIALMGTAIKAFAQHPKFAKYQLKAADLDVIARLYFEASVNFDRDVRAKDIFEMSPCLDKNLNHRFAFLVSLLDRNIIALNRNGISNYRYNFCQVIDANFSFDAYLLSLLMGKDSVHDATEYLSQNLPKSTQPLKTITKAMMIHFVSYADLIGDAHENLGCYYGRTVHELLDVCLLQIESLPSSTSLKTFIAQYQLSVFDLKCILVLYVYQLELRMSLSSVSLLNLLSCNAEEFDANEIALNEGNLKKNGLIEMERSFRMVLSVELSEKALQELASETPPIENVGNSKLGTLLKNTDLLSLIKTEQTLEQLILPVPDKELIASLIHRLKQPEQYNLAKWGLLSASLSSDSDALKGCNILLHGHPGTGKTFIAGVMANEIGSALIQINANKLRNMYYGSTEKNVRELFVEMRHIVHNVSPSPVFLLNEGDQLIHKRGNTQNSPVSNVENSIQSIFLEEMETFPGILIVTTNLLENMDVAMSRRFHYKLELTPPDAICREKLWRIHLPETIPGASDIDVRFLAEKYSFTGGQIRLVVQNACYEAMSRGEDAFLCIMDLVKYANMEDGNSFETPVTAKVGFLR